VQVAPQQIAPQGNAVNATQVRSSASASIIPPQDR
jgi:hypothetical protein